MIANIMELSNAIGQIKAQTRDKVKQQHLQSLIQSIAASENAAADKNIVVQCFMAALDHLKTAKESSQATALRAVRIVVPALVDQQVDVATSLMMSYIFTEFQVQSDAICDEVLQLVKTLLEHHSLFVNDLQVLFVQKLALILANPKVSALRRSEFERISGQFLDFLQNKQQNLRDVYVEYLQFCVCGAAADFRLCQKQVLCMSPIQALGAIYNSHDEETQRKALSWKLSSTQLQNNAKALSTNLAPTDVRETSMQLCGVLAGKGIRGQPLLQGVYYYMLCALACELNAGRQLSLALLSELGQLDNLTATATVLLYLFLFVREQGTVDADVYEQFLAYLSAYFLREKVFTSVLFQTISQPDSIRQYLKLPNEEFRQLVVPGSLTLQSFLRPDTFASLMVQRDPEHFVAFLSFVAFQQLSCLFWNNSVTSMISGAARLSLLHVHVFFINIVQSSALIVYSFDQLLQIALQLDKCDDDANVVQYLQSTEQQVNRLLQIDAKPCNRPIIVADSFLFKIVANLMLAVNQLRHVPNYLHFQAIFMSMLIGLVVSTTKQQISSIDIGDVQAFLLEQADHQKLDRAAVQFLEAFAGTYNVGAEQQAKQRANHIADLQTYFSSLLQLSLGGVDKLYDKLVVQIFINETQSVFDVDSLFAILKTFSTPQYRSYLTKLLPEENRMLKTSAMSLLVTNISYQLLLQSSLEELSTDSVAYQLIYEHRGDEAHADILAKYRESDFTKCVTSISNEQLYSANQDEISTIFSRIFQFSCSTGILIANVEIERQMVYFLQLSALTPTESVLRLLQEILSSKLVLHQLEETTKLFLRQYLFDAIQNLNLNKFLNASKQQFNQETLQQLPVTFCQNIDDERYIMELLSACQQVIFGAKSTGMTVKLLFNTAKCLTGSFLFTSGAMQYADFVALLDVFVVGTMSRVLELLLKQQNQSKRSRYLDVQTQLFLGLREFLQAVSAPVQKEFVYIFSACAILFKDCVGNELQDLYYDVVLRFAAHPSIIEALLESTFEFTDLNRGKLVGGSVYSPRGIEVLSNGQVVRYLDQLIQQVSFANFVEDSRRKMLEAVLWFCIDKKLYLKDVFQLLIDQLFLIDKQDGEGASEDYLLESEQDQEEGADVAVTLNAKTVIMLHRAVQQLDSQSAELNRLFDLVFAVRHVATQRLVLCTTFSLLGEAEETLKRDVLIAFAGRTIAKIEAEEFTSAFLSGLFGTLFAHVIRVFNESSAEQQDALIDAALRLSESTLARSTLEFYGARCDVLFLLAQMRCRRPERQDLQNQLFALVESFLTQLTPNCAVQRQTQRKILLGRRLRCEALSDISVFAPIAVSLSPARVASASSIDLNFLNAHLLEFCFSTLRGMGEDAAAFILRMYTKIAANYVIESQLCGSCPMRLGNAALAFFEFCLDECFGAGLVKAIFKTSLDLLEKGKDVDRFRHQLLEKLARAL